MSQRRDKPSVNKDEKRLTAKHPLASLKGLKLVLTFIAADEALRKGTKFYNQAGKRLTTPEKVLDALLDGEIVTEGT